SLREAREQRGFGVQPGAPDVGVETAAAGIDRNRLRVAGRELVGVVGDVVAEVEDLGLALAQAGLVEHDRAAGLCDHPEDVFLRPATVAALGLPSAAKRGHAG